MPCQTLGLPLTRALQAALVIADLVLIGAWRWYGQGESIQPLGDGDASLSSLWLVLWWSSPALLLFAHRTRTGTLLTGTALLVASGIALASIYASEHSRAAIGFFTVPVLRGLLALAFLFGEILLAHWHPLETPPESRQGRLG